MLWTVTALVTLVAVLAIRHFNKRIEAHNARLEKEMEEIDSEPWGC